MKHGVLIRFGYIDLFHILLLQAADVRKQVFRCLSVEGLHSLQYIIASYNI